jgi:hypothetical protein
VHGSSENVLLVAWFHNFTPVTLSAGAPTPAHVSVCVRAVLFPRVRASGAPVIDPLYSLARTGRA